MATKAVGGTALERLQNYKEPTIKRVTKAQQTKIDAVTLKHEKAVEQSTALGTLSDLVSNFTAAAAVLHRPYDSPFDKKIATLTPTVGRKGIIYEGEVRHLLKSGKYKITGSMTNSKVALSTSTIKDGASTNPQNDRYRRYNISAEGPYPGFPSKVLGMYILLADDTETGYEHHLHSCTIYILHTVQ